MKQQGPCGILCFFIVALALKASPVQQSPDPSQGSHSSRYEGPGEVRNRATGLDSSWDNRSVPPVIRFSGTVKVLQGKSRIGVVGITFSIYEDEDDLAPVWLETQNVELDQEGRYTVLLGITKREGLPVDLFASGKIRWLGIRVEQEPEDPRILLASVPYALKAQAAEQLAGRPASDFVLFEQLSKDLQDRLHNQQDNLPLASAPSDGTSLGSFADLRCGKAPSAPPNNSTRVYCLVSSEKLYTVGSSGTVTGPLAGLDQPQEWGAPQSFDTVFIKKSNNVRKCDQFEGADAGEKIAACLADLPDGGVLDARGFEGTQTISKQLIINKPVTLLLGHASFACTTGSTGSPSCIEVVASSVRIIGYGTIIQTLGTPANGVNYWLIRIIDSLGALRDIEIRGLDLRLLVNASGSSSALLGPILAQAVNSGISKVRIVDNTWKTTAPDLGAAYKWFGIFIWGRSVAGGPLRNINNVVISNNFSDSSHGRNIETFEATGVVIANNVLTNVSPDNWFGGVGIRAIATDNLAITGNVVTVGKNGKALCYYIGANADLVGDESTNVSFSGNTCHNASTVRGSGYGLRLVGVKDASIVGNTFVNDDIKGAQFGIAINDVAGLTNQDIFVTGNHIKGFASQQIRVDPNTSRAVIGLNYLGPTAQGYQSFMFDGSASTRYVGWEYSGDGLSTTDFIAFDPGAASIGRIRLANNQGIYWRDSTNKRDLGLLVTSANHLEFNGELRVSSASLGERAGFSPLGQAYIDNSFNIAAVLNQAAKKQAGFLTAYQDNNGNKGIWASYALAEARHTSGTKSALIAMEGNAVASTAGGITRAIGVEGEAFTSGGGTITRLLGVAGYAEQSGTGTTTDMAALLAYTNTRSGGIVTNNYGLLIEDQSSVGINNWAIRTLGQAPSQFGGAVDSGVGFRVGGVAPSGSFLRGDGAFFVPSLVTIGGPGSCTDQFVRAVNDNAPPTCASVTGSDISDGSVEAVDVSARLKTEQFTYTFIDLANDLPDTYDVTSIYPNRSRPITITEVYCEIDGGAASINLQRNDGTPNNILVTDLECLASGAATREFLPSENEIAVGDRIDHVTASVGPSLHRLTVVFTYLVE